MLVIQLTGYPRVGKDHFVTTVRNRFPELKLFTIAYADKLKTMHMDDLGIDNLKAYNLMLHENILYKKSINLRKDLDRFANTIKRKNYNYFTNHVRDIVYSLKDIDLAIITDMRYASEYSYAKEAGHTIIRIDRGKISKKDKKQSWNELIETFETNVIIDNNGSLKGYERRVVECLNSLLDNT